MISRQASWNLSDALTSADWLGATAFMGTNPQNAAQLVVNEPVMAEKHSLRMSVTRRNNR
jgi:hypothetical protein